MNKNPQPDTPVLRGALIAGCSLWKPIVQPVCHAKNGARLAEDSVEESVERAAARFDAPGEDRNAPQPKT